MKTQDVDKKHTGGDCFAAAAKYVLDNNGWTLVHGMATGRGPISGVRHAHAWVERDGIVLEVANGKRDEFPRVLYYAIGCIAGARCYTKAQARAFILTSEHWGPWE